MNDHSMNLVRGRYAAERTSWHAMLRSICEISDALAIDKGDDEEDTHELIDESVNAVAMTDSNAVHSVPADQDNAAADLSDSDSTTLMAVSEELDAEARS